MTRNYKFLYFIYALIINGLVTFFLPISFTISFRKPDIGNGTTNVAAEISFLLSSVQVALNVYACAVKILIMAFFLSTLKSTSVVLKKLDARCQTKEEKRVIFKVIKTGRRMVLGFASAYWSYAVASVLSSVLLGRPPYSLYLPYINWKNSKWEFALASIIEFFLMYGACSQEVVNDSYAAIYVNILRAHLKALSIRISRLGTNLEDNEKDIYANLKQCILDHKLLIEYHKFIL